MAKINIQFPVKNAGNIKATNVIGTVTEPSDVSFIKATTLKGTYNNTSKEWTIPTLLAGEEAQLNLQFNIDDFESFPFEFVIDFSSDQDPDSDPTNNSKTVIINEEDVFPCPDCPPPSVDLEDTEWSRVVVDLGIDNKCLGCDLEVEVVPLSEDNVESVEIDSEKGIAKVVLEDPFEDWSFDIEASCINCPYWCGESNSYGPFGPKTISGPGACCSKEDKESREDFEGLENVNTITLGSEAENIKYVFIEGLLVVMGDYIFDGVDKITFDSPVSGDIVVIYNKV